MGIKETADELADVMAVVRVVSKVALAAAADEGVTLDATECKSLLNALKILRDGGKA